MKTHLLIEFQGVRATKFQRNSLGNTVVRNSVIDCTRNLRVTTPSVLLLRPRFQDLRTT